MLWRSPSAKEESGFALNAQDARCMAEAVVTQLDLDQLQNDGVSPQELGNASDLTEFSDAVQPEASDDLPEELAACNLGNGLLQTFATAFGTSVETIDCVGASIDDAEVAGLYASTLLTGADGEAAGQEYGEELIAGLPGDCARTVVLALLLEGDAITDAEVPCLEQEMSDELARQMIGPDGSSSEVQAGVGSLIQTCSS